MIDFVLKMTDDEDGGGGYHEDGQYDEGDGECNRSGSRGGGRRAQSADRSRLSSSSGRRSLASSRPGSGSGSAFGSGFGSGTAAAARRSRSPDRSRRAGSPGGASPQLALGGRSGGGSSKSRAANPNGNAPLLRFEAWGLKADTPYRFHIQAVNGHGRGLWGHDATLRTSSVREYVWKHDGDENGVLYWLGTGGPERQRHTYRNPAKDGTVAVVASHPVSSSTAHWMFVGRSNARAYIDCRHPGTWLAVDLRRYALRPSRYVCRCCLLCIYMPALDRSLE